MKETESEGRGRKEVRGEEEGRPGRERERVITFSGGCSFDCLKKPRANATQVRRSAPQTLAHTPSRLKPQTKSAGTCFSQSNRCFSCWFAVTVRAETILSALVGGSMARLRKHKTGQREQLCNGSPSPLLPHHHFIRATCVTAPAGSVSCSPVYLVQFFPSSFLSLEFQK